MDHQPIVNLMRTDLRGLDPNPPALPIAAIERRVGRSMIKLDTNENPYGPAPGVEAALRSCRVERYPDAACTDLRKGLSEYIGVEPERIVCSAGGDEMLELLVRLFLEPGDEVIDCTPSFVMYPLVALYNRGTVVRVPRGEGFAVDVEGVERSLTSRAKLIFLCSPNNPTGNLTPTEDVVQLLETGRVVVLDEAYAEFAGQTLVRLTNQYPNLVVLRTFSKWAALAGVRLGYAIVDPAVAERLGVIRSPFTVSAPAQAAGIASLHESHYLLENVRRIVSERERLRERLSALSFGTVFPSVTNFLYWSSGGVSGRALWEALAYRGVLVRALNDPVEALRFSIGLPEESDVLVAALKEAYAELAG